MKLYSYIVRSDLGLAPNPYWGELTLNVCKPQIRKTANINDWIVGTGSKYVKNKNGGIKNYSGLLVYAMKVTNKMTMREYDGYCLQNLQNKIPHKKEPKVLVGDSIYNYSECGIPLLRKIIHTENQKAIDLSGKNTLLSKEFYYFGEKAQPIPAEFSNIIKKEQGHLIVKDTDLINRFKVWLNTNFEINKLYGEPQLQWQIDHFITGDCSIKCID